MCCLSEYNLQFLACNATDSYRYQVYTSTNANDVGAIFHLHVTQPALVQTHLMVDILLDTLSIHVFILSSYAFCFAFRLRQPGIKHYYYHYYCIQSYFDH